MVAAVVLVIAALLASVLAGSGSKDCKYEVKTGHRYRSHDNIEIIKIPKGQDVNYCKEKCNAMDNCDRFNYNGKRRKCWLKSGDEKKHPLDPNEKSDAYVKVSCEAECPEGFTLIEAKCYVLVKEKKSFDDAKSTCQDLGGQLANFQRDIETVKLQTFRDELNEPTLLSISDLAWASANDGSHQAFYYYPDDQIWTPVSWEITTKLLPFLCTA